MRRQRALRGDLLVLMVVTRERAVVATAVRNGSIVGRDHVQVEADETGPGDARGSSGNAVRAVADRA